jgi:hypothetical protein
MKKLIAILAVFAFLGAALFAQDEGSWSVGGSGRIGTAMNFLPVENTFGSSDVSHAGVWADGWDQNRDENVLGKLDVMYNKGGLSAGFGIDQQFGFQGKLNFNGENFQFGAEQNLERLIARAGYITGTFTGVDFDADGTDDADILTRINQLLDEGSNYRDQLWGNFTFQALNGIKVEAAVSRRGQQWWNVTDYFGDTFTHTDWGRGGTNAGAPGFALDGKLGTQSYLLVDASPMAGLNIGFVIPNVFVYNATADNQASADLQTQALQGTVFGGKFVSGPIQVGFQFALKGQQNDFFDKDWKVTNKRDDLRSGLYLGATYQINDQMRAGFEFRGIFGEQTLVNKDGDVGIKYWNGSGNAPAQYAYRAGQLYTGVWNPATGRYDGTGSAWAAAPADISTADYSFKDSAQFGIGAQFDFNQGPFGVNVRLRFRDNDTATSHSETFYVRIRPYFNLVEGFLRAQLTTEFTFKDVIDPEATAKATDNKNVWAGVVDYTIQPELYFNFLGTNAGNWDTGFAFRYRWQGPAGYFEPTKGHNTAHFLELVFNWKF